MSSSLHQVITNSKIIFVGESGSHFLNFYSPLQAYMLAYLNKKEGLKTFIIEGGSATAYLCNKYLETGDSNYLPKFSQERSFVLWKLIYTYNQTIPVSNRLKVMGIDFESPIAYFKALNYLIPAKEPPAQIQKEIALIRSSVQPMNCNGLTKTDKLLKKSLLENPIIWKEYTGENYTEIVTIISNEGSCKDALGNRNKNLKKRFLEFDALLKEPLYYGQFGQAHTTLDSKSHFASMLNNDDRTSFYHKVCVINTYCQHCTTAVEPVSNWVLKKIEPDIQSTLLKFCTSDFTLFDFSGSPDITQQYLQYGQFLLIAKDQQ
ncbi:MAG: hypothetical protein ABI480_06985 [Chitinophagaceae bacterium]